ncbi:hypothetical protein [Caballeronia sp. AZ7_KS35]|uniref:hypothetical protein n=1 Tax=Caballeronia sp. AZ7_KS35 TaxID=2921762 RepID=UPI0020278D13|nr:hypothetical protein [Caballeronia sp. AZ7_KS35]
MTDGELLESAARAAGYEWRTDIAAHRNEIGVVGLWIPGVSTLWNPLDDDGDALRLAVRMQLTVCNEHISCGQAYCTHGEDAEMMPTVNSGSNESEVIPSDYAATRRAIVLAAAQIAGNRRE